MYERDIKYKIFEHLLHTEEKGSVFINEFGVNWARARADIAVINGFIHLIEIKSSHDSLGRLDRQIKLFLPYAEKTTVVVADKHYKKVAEKVPSFVGIYVVKEDRLEIDRKPMIREISPQALAEYWWAEELKVLLGRLVKGAHRMSVDALRRHLIKLTTPEILCKLTKQNLKHRYSKRSQKLIDSVLNNKPFAKWEKIEIDRKFILKLREQLLLYSERKQLASLS